DEIAYAGDERVVHRLVGVDTLDGGARLTAVDEAPENDGVRRALDVAVGARDERGLAAELEDARHEVRAARGRDAFARIDASGEDELLDAALDEGGADVAAPVDDAEEIFGQAGRVEDLLRLPDRERRDLARLEHHGVAGDERAQYVPHRDHEGEVPRRDHA